MDRLSRACQLLAQKVNIFKNPAILIWIFLLVILFPILRPGFFSVHDETHIVDVYEMIRSLQLGGFPPRFAPDFNFNIGHPYFNFYYHLPFYITAKLNFLGFSLTDSFKYMMGIAVIVAAWGFYFFLRNHVSKLAAVVGTSIFLLSPYFAVDLYVRGAFGELFIFALMPWCAFFIKKYLDNKRFLFLGMAGFLIGLLSISHNVLLPFAYLILFGYGLTNLIANKKKPKEFIKLFLPFVLGICLAAYYLLPAFFEIKYISSYEQFNIVDHFPFIKQLLIPHWGYSVSIWGPLDDISFDIGSVNLLMVVLAIILFKFIKKEQRSFLIYFFIVFGITLILTNNRTLPFWESINFLRLVQFPWRMLLFITIATSFISAIAFETALNKLSKRSGLIFSIALVVLLTALNIWHYHPSESKEVTDEEYLERYFANRTVEGNGVRNELSHEYLNFTEDFVPPTIWQSDRPDRILEPVSVTPSGIVQYNEKGLGYEINYQATESGEIIVSKAFFPSWKAKNSEGADLEILPYSEYGIIAIPVKAGSGTIHLKYGNTQIENTANIISAISALVILVLLVYPKGLKK